MTGGRGNDTLFGGDGLDELDAGKGNDTISDRSGNDVYRFDLTETWGHDTIAEGSTDEADELWLPDVDVP